MTLRKLFCSALCCCSASLIAFSVIPVSRVDAAEVVTTEIMTAAQTAALFGDTLSGTYYTGQEYMPCTFTRYGVLQASDITNASNAVNTNGFFTSQSREYVLYYAAVDVGNVPTADFTVYVEPVGGLSNLRYLEASVLCSAGGLWDGFYDAPASTYTNNSWAVTTDGTAESVDAPVNNNNRYAYIWANVPHVSDASQKTNIALRPCYYFNQSDTAFTFSSQSVTFSGVKGNTAVGGVVIAIACSTVSSGYTVSLPGGDDVDIDVIVGDIKDIMSDNNGILTQIYNFIVDLPETLISGIHDLFIPSQQDLEQFKDNVDELLHDTFGGLYDAENMVHDGLSDVRASSTNTVHFPGISVAGFTLDAADVPIKPPGFDALFDTLATVIDIICTFAFLNMLKSKLSQLLGEGEKE